MPNTDKLWQKADEMWQEADKVFSQVKPQKLAEQQNVQVRLSGGRWFLFWYFLKCAFKGLFRGKIMVEYKKR